MNAVGGSGSRRLLSPNVDPALYQNLVEMIPLMETFMDQQGSRSMFGHHQAPMIYTPAPPRDVSSKKTLESSLKRKDSLSLKRTLSREDAKEEPVWEETENILRRVERDSIQEEFHACQFPHKDTRLLHLEIEELKQKLWEKDALLETMSIRPSQSTRQLTFEEKEISEKDSHLEVAIKHASGEDRGVADKDPMRLQAMVEKLQHELWEKDCYVQSANLQLHEQQHGLGEMRTLLEHAEIGMTENNHKAASLEAELNGLRCQVLTLRYQLDALDGTSVTAGDQPQQDEADREGPPYRVDMVSTISEQEVDQKTTFLVCVSGPNDEEHVSSISEESKEEKETLDMLRRQYLAAVIAAREKPVGESLTMVAECRRQLSNCLVEPHFIHILGPQCLRQTQ